MWSLARKMLHLSSEIGCSRHYCPRKRPELHSGSLRWCRRGHSESWGPTSWSALGLHPGRPLSTGRWNQSEGQTWWLRSFRWPSNAHLCRQWASFCSERRPSRGRCGWCSCTIAWCCVCPCTYVRPCWSGQTWSSSLRPLWQWGCLNLDPCSSPKLHRVVYTASFSNFICSISLNIGQIRRSRACLPGYWSAASRACSGGRDFRMSLRPAHPYTPQGAGRSYLGLVVN